jgi:hypothetical protein
LIGSHTRQQKDSTRQIRLELCLWVELPEQSGLEKLRIVPRERRPSAAVAALANMLLDERKVRHGDGFMVSLRLATVGGVVADGAANPLQRPGKIGLL